MAKSVRRLRRNLHKLAALGSRRRRDERALRTIFRHDPDLLACLFDACINIASGNLTLSSHERRQLRPHVAPLRRCAYKLRTSPLASRIAHLSRHPGLVRTLSKVVAKAATDNGESASK